MEQEQIDQILRKFDEFTLNQMTEQFLKTKPKYIEILQKELQKPTLKDGEYFRIPFNPYKETFSELLLYYFLGIDGFLKKYHDFRIGWLPVIREIDTFIQIIEFLPYDKDEETFFLIHPKSMNIVFILKNYYISTRNLLSKTFFDLEENIKKIFEAESANSYHDENGILFLLGKSDNPTYETLQLLSKGLWTKGITNINLTLSDEKYQIMMFYKQHEKKKNTVIYVPGQEFINLYVNIINNNYREKKFS